MLLITGIFENASVSRLSINPATTNVWPSASSTLVSARRVASAGIRNPCSVTALA